MISSNTHLTPIISTTLPLILFSANNPTRLQVPQGEVQFPNLPMQQVFWWSLREQDSYWLEYEMHYYTPSELIQILL